MNDKVNKVSKYVEIIIIVLCLVLCTKLFLVGIIQQKGFSALSKNQINVTIKQPLPRGKILDKNGIILAQDQELNTLNYIEPGIMKTAAKEALALKIAQIIDFDTININEVELQDFVLNKNDNLKTITSNFTDEDKIAINKMDEKTYNQFLRSKLTPQQIQAVVNTYNEKQLYIILLMHQASSKKSVVIKDHLTEKEYYQLSMIDSQIGGFYLAKAYKREYPQGDLMRSFLGNYGPIPKDQLPVYQSQGYNTNDYVGTSYLELALESVLRPYDQIMNLLFDKEGNIIGDEIEATGQQGNNAYLTIDANIQRLVENNLITYLENNHYEYAKNDYATIINPDNGNIIAIGGKSKVNGKIVDNSIGNFTQSYTLGSTIKPAILSLGYASGIWQHDQIVDDQPLYFQGTPKKSSYTNMGPINEQEAIARSSNVYFYNVLLKLANAQYIPHGGLDINPQKFAQVRSFLQEYGLGSSSGIGLSQETTGITGERKDPGLYLDLANGQYDTYTNLAQTQYAATIEDLGTRYKINYLDKVVKPNYYTNQEQILYQQKPEILNKVNIDPKDAQHVRDMMDNTKNFPHSTVGNKGFRVNKRLSAKTGTSESFYYDLATKTTIKTNTTSFIGTYQGNHKYSIGIVVPDFTSDGVLNQKEAGHIASGIVNELEKNNA